jgi:hypothetical protein
MKIKQITIDEALHSSRKEYNPSIWTKEVNAYQRYENPVYYQDIESDRVYVEYTINEGIRLFKEVCYSHCLSSASFKRVDMKAVNSQGISEPNYMLDLVDRINANEITQEEAKQLFAELDKTIDHYIVTFGGFYVEGESGVYGMPNNIDGRKQMAEKSKKYGLVFSNEF